jgi:hypothetical protein
MPPEPIEELGPAFADYLPPFLFGCDYPQTFDRLGVTAAACSPTAHAQPANPAPSPRASPSLPYQEFLRDHRWSFAQVRTRLQQHVAATLPTLPALPADDLGTGGLPDETGTVKDGVCTPGVQRPYGGAVGQVENGIVTVPTGLAKGRSKTRFDADRFLPESWDQDRDRCRKARLPDDRRYRPKWPIALGQLDRAWANGLGFDWFPFDEGYGDQPGYLSGLDQRPLRYVGEVPKSFPCFGRRPRPGPSARRADDRVRHRPRFQRPRGQLVRWARPTGGAPAWEGKAARVGRAGGGKRTYGWRGARNQRTGEEKYFLSNAAANESLGRRVRAALGRWNVEHGLRRSQSAIGFRHFAGRSSVARRRHWTWCRVPRTFGAGPAADRRGEQPRRDRRASRPRSERGGRGVAGAPAGDEPTARPVGGHRLPPAAEPRRTGMAPPPEAWPAGRLLQGGVTPGTTRPDAKKTSTTAKSITVALYC